MVCEPLRLLLARFTRSVTADLSNGRPVSFDLGRHLLIIKRACGRSSPIKRLQDDPPLSRAAIVSPTTSDMPTIHPRLVRPGLLLLAVFE